MSTAPATARAEAARLPRQIPFIIGNEACERFSFDGMRNILTRPKELCPTEAQRPGDGRPALCLQPEVLEDYFLAR